MRSADSEAYRLALLEGRVGRPGADVDIEAVAARRAEGTKWWEIERDTGWGRRSLQRLLARRRKGFY